MSILLRLPDDLLSEVCSDWTELKTLVNVDSSMTNKKCRSNLIKVMYNSSVNLGQVTINFNVMNWIYARNIKVNELTLSTDCFDSTDQLLCPINCSKVKVFRFDKRYRLKLQQTIHAMNECCSLKTIIAEENINLSFVDLFPKIHSQILYHLTELKILIDEEYKTVAKYCSNLTSITVENVTSEEFKDLLNKNPKITSLSIKNVPTPRDFERMLQTLPESIIKLSANLNSAKDTLEYFRKFPDVTKIIIEQNLNFSDDDSCFTCLKNKQLFKIKFPLSYFCDLDIFRVLSKKVTEIKLRNLQKLNEQSLINIIKQNKYVLKFIITGVFDMIIDFTTVKKRFENENRGIEVWFKDALVIKIEQKMEM
jgi:hypothetical protein